MFKLMSHAVCLVTQASVFGRIVFYLNLPANVGTLELTARL